MRNYLLLCHHNTDTQAILTQKSKWRVPMKLFHTFLAITILTNVTSRAMENVNEQLLKAVKEGNSKRIHQLITSGADLNFKNSQQMTALMYAALTGNLTIAQELIAAKADPNIQDQNGTTALMFAALTGRLEIAQELLHAGADLYIQDHHGERAFIWAMKDQLNAQIRQEITNARASAIITNMAFNKYESEKIEVAKLFITKMLEGSLQPDIVQKYPLDQAQKNQIIAFMKCYERKKAGRDVARLIGKELKVLLQTKNMIEVQIDQSDIDPKIKCKLFDYLDTEAIKTQSSKGWLKSCTFM